jgi:hypothetical protein
MKKPVGSAIEPFLVGRDPKRRAEIETKLFADFKPQDVLEEIWLSDIAVLTTTIEYYRNLEASLTLHIAKRYNLEEQLRDEFPGKKDITFNDAAGTVAFHTTLGKFTATDVKRISDIADLTSKMRRERERVYLLFERKRRPAVLNAVKVAETGGTNKYVVEDLSE